MISYSQSYFFRNFRPGTGHYLVTRDITSHLVSGMGHQVWLMNTIRRFGEIAGFSLATAELCPRAVSRMTWKIICMTSKPSIIVDLSSLLTLETTKKQDVRH